MDIIFIGQYHRIFFPKCYNVHFNWNPHPVQQELHNILLQVVSGNEPLFSRIHMYTLTCLSHPRFSYILFYIHSHMNQEHCKIFLFHEKHTRKILKCFFVSTFNLKRFNNKCITLKRWNRRKWHFLKWKLVKLLLIGNNNNCNYKYY